MTQSTGRRKTDETSPSEGTPDARERIFLAAERLFAERGFDGVSVRDIVQAAEVNLAAVSYYFGSKGELLLAVFRSRARELNRERRALLREAEARHGGDPPLADILRALMGPPILWRDPASGKDTASRFISRAMAEVTPDLRKILESDVSHLRGFLAALSRALPHLSEPEVCWALHFTVALPHQCTDTNFKRLEGAVRGGCDTEDVAAVLKRAVRYAIGGIEAFAAPRAAAGSRRAEADRATTTRVGQPDRREQRTTGRRVELAIDRTRRAQAMDFEYSPKVEELRARVREFMDRYVIPNNTRWRREVAAGLNPPPVVEELKPIAKSEGLWNLFLPGLKADEPGTRLDQPRIRARSPRSWASCNGRRKCSTARRRTPATWSSCTSSPRPSSASAG